MSLRQKAKKLDSAAKRKIEDSLADLIPVAIDLVAKLLNIGNIATKVQNIIEGVRGLIDEALDAVFETVLGALGVGSKKTKDDDGEGAATFEEVRFELTTEEGEKEGRQAGRREEKKEGGRDML